MPSAGTYTLLVDPSTDSTGTATMSLYGVNDISETMAIDGPAVIVPIVAPGQKARLALSATGQRVSIVGSQSGVVANGTPGATLWGPLAVLNGATVLREVSSVCSMSVMIGHSSLRFTCWPPNRLPLARAVPNTWSEHRGGKIRTYAARLRTLKQQAVWDALPARGLRQRRDRRVGPGPQQSLAPGDYIVVVDPYEANTGSINVAATNP
jgi:hypothetical protein